MRLTGMADVAEPDVSTFCFCALHEHLHGPKSRGHEAYSKLYEPASPVEREESFPYSLRVLSQNAGCGCDLADPQVSPPAYGKKLHVNAGWILGAGGFIRLARAMLMLWNRRLFLLLVSVLQRKTTCMI